MASSLGGVYGTTKKPTMGRVAKHNPAGMHGPKGMFRRAPNEPPKGMYKKKGKPKDY